MLENVKQTDVKMEILEDTADIDKELEKELYNVVL